MSIAAKVVINSNDITEVIALTFQTLTQKYQSDFFEFKQKIKNFVLENKNLNGFDEFLNDFIPTRNSELKNKQQEAKKSLIENIKSYTEKHPNDMRTSDQSYFDNWLSMVLSSKKALFGFVEPNIQMNIPLFTDEEGYNPNGKLSSMSFSARASFGQKNCNLFIGDSARDYQSEIKILNGIELVDKAVVIHSYLSRNSDFEINLLKDVAKNILKNSNKPSQVLINENDAISSDFVEIKSQTVKKQKVRNDDLVI